VNNTKLHNILEPFSGYRAVLVKLSPLTRVPLVNTFVLGKNIDINNCYHILLKLDSLDYILLQTVWVYLNRTGSRNGWIR